jgi:dTDP-4-dehydrorhamnose reductase
MKVCVFGANGMLGRYVSTYLKKSYEIIEVTRKDIDLREANLTSLSNWIELNGGLYTNDTIVNCAGVIRQRSSDDLSFIKVNSVFPYVLQAYASIKHINLIHISTDCVFSGKRGSYTEKDIPDPDDIYSVTKLAGEPPGCMVIRTSIIGEGDFKGSLLEWVKGQKKINGFTNHLWNGVTCLQLAKLIGKIIGGHKWFGIRHYFSSPVTKAELVREIIKVYELNTKVTDIEAPVMVDRTLDTIYKGFFDFPPDIRTQLIEQKILCRDESQSKTSNVEVGP